MAKKGKIKIGTISSEDMRKQDRRTSRESALENSTGWVSIHKVHKGKKDKQEHRNRKHKGGAFLGHP